MKLSPLTVPYRALQRASTVLLVAVFAVNADANRLVGGRIGVIALAGVALLATLAYELAYYSRFTYELTEDTLDIRSGVIRRRERELPYRRIQNVDVTRSVVPRLLGLAVVDFETAGGSETEGSIRFVSAVEAERLQREIQRRKHSEDEPGSDRSEDADEVLFAIEPRELGLVGALSFDARVVGLVGLAGPGSIPFLSGAIPAPTTLLVAMAGPLVVGLLLAAWLVGIAVAVVNYYGFRLTRAGDELRYERGLIGRYTGSIPLSKVQAVVVEDNPLKRAFGYATLRVETAGYSPGGSARGSQVAVPIANRERVLDLASDVAPTGEVDFERPPRRIRRRYAVRYLLALAALGGVALAVDRFVGVALPWYGVVPLALLVPPAAHLTWRHRGYWVGEDHVVTRNGFWSRKTSIVPYYRIQTVIDSRTAFQRRWGVGTVVVDTAGSSSLTGQGAAAVDIEVDEAIDLRQTLVERLREALAERRRVPGDSARR